MHKKSIHSLLLSTCCVIVLLALMMLGQKMSSASAAPPQYAPLQAGTPAPTSTAETPAPSTHYSSESVGLVFGLFLLMGLLFYLLFIYSNKLDNASYLGGLYVDTVEEIEYGRLATALREKFDKGGYRDEVLQDKSWTDANREPEPSDELLKLGYVKSPYLGASGYLSAFRGMPYLDYSKDNAPNSAPTSPGDDEPSTGAKSENPGKPKLGAKSAEKTYEQLAREYEQKFAAWQEQVNREAARRYAQALGDQPGGARNKAKERASRAAFVDLSVLRGRGTEFVLEFTTVVVIIFAAVALGVLQILKAEQIGTLLAAIAGYVLGRAVSRTQKQNADGTTSEAERRTAVSTAELADLVRAVGGVVGSGKSTPAELTDASAEATPAAKPTAATATQAAKQSSARGPRGQGGAAPM